MIRSTVAIVLTVTTASVAFAQNAPPTYQADPDVYKMIFEDENFRVIAATWKKGAHDKDHSHPSASIFYTISDCSIRVHAPDGKTRDLINKAGTAIAIPITPSHSAENIGASDCQGLLVERK
jgi:quercetin dioxygenase-like cupin family protein